MQKGIVKALITGAVCLFLGTTAFAAEKQEIRVENELTTGKVEISLEEYELSGGKKYLSGRQFRILPGKEISLIPTIKNEGAPCYVRISMSFEGTEYLNADQLFGMGKNWVLLEDGCYYLTTPLKEGESSELFQGIRIPLDFPQSEEGKTVELELCAEAVQAENFTPDFTGAEPWGSVKILDAGNEQIPRTDRTSANGQFSVIFEGITEGFVKNAEDFFAGFPVFYPGAAYEDTLVLKNDSEDKLRLYFSQEAENSELLENLFLRITLKENDSERIVYDGALRGKKLEKDMLLAVIPAGEEKRLTYLVTMGKELDNSYAAKLDQVTWRFRAETGNKTSKTSVFTGDREDFAFWVLVLGISLASLFLGSRIYIKKKK